MTVPRKMKIRFEKEHLFTAYGSLKIATEDMSLRCLGALSEPLLELSAEVVRIAIPFLEAIPGGENSRDCATFGYRPATVRLMAAQR